MTKQKELPKFLATGIIFGIHGFSGKRAHFVVTVLVTVFQNKVRICIISWLVSRAEFSDPISVTQKIQLIVTKILFMVFTAYELAVCDGIGFLEGLAIKPAILGSLFNQSMIDLVPTLLKK